MGIYDREYYRDESAPGLRASSPRSMAVTLVMINVGVAILNMFTTNNMLVFDLLAATPQSLSWTEPWLILQTLTYGFAHSPNELNHILFNMFALWMFGRDVESVYGPKEFLRIYLISIVLGGLFWTIRTSATGLTETSLVGASGGVATIVILFCMNFPKRTILLMFVFPMPAWVLGILIIAVNLFGGSATIAYDVHLVGIAFGICYFQFRWNFNRFSPQFSTKWFRPRPKLKLHDPDIAYRDLDDKADELLKKVNQNGIESLSSKERRILEDYSRRMRQKHR